MSDAVKLAKIRALSSNGTAREARQAARLSLSEVGTHCGTDASTVHKWESGTRRPRGEPGLKYADLIQELLAL